MTDRGNGTNSNRLMKGQQQVQCNGVKYATGSSQCWKTAIWRVASTTETRLACGSHVASAVNTVAKTESALVTPLGRPA